jgi:hypothetical protein
MPRLQKVLLRARDFWQHRRNRAAFVLPYREFSVGLRFIPGQAAPI